MTAKVLGVGAVLSATLLTGCLSSLPVSEAPGGGSLGSFDVAVPAVTQGRVEPAACSAGDRQQFLGADLADPASGVVVRLVVDPLGDAAVRVFAAAAPFDRSVVFRRAECATFHFSIDSTGWRVNDVDDYRVTLQLDCRTAAGSIAGQASATHCH